MSSGNNDIAASDLNRAIHNLRNAGTYDNLPRGLLARAALLRETEEYKKSRRDLGEAMRLASRCGMRLFECDAHLEYARLEIKQRQCGKAREHLEKAAKLVSACGYHRRDGEVEELEAALS